LVLVWIEAGDEIKFGKALKDETSTVDVDGIESKEIVYIKGKMQEDMLITDVLVKWTETFVVLKNLANEPNNFLLSFSFLFLFWQNWKPEFLLLNMAHLVYCSASMFAHALQA